MLKQRNIGLESGTQTMSKSLLTHSITLKNIYIYIFYLNKMLCPLMRRTGKAVCWDYSNKMFF